jgi:hypothetical protein
MAATDFAILAMGIFVLGTVAGVIIVVAAGIRREERIFREWRRSQQEQSTWDGPGRPDHYLPETPPDRLSQGARILTGLHIRRYRRGGDPGPTPRQDKRA